jgi:seryl-tRNA synthetase
VTELREELLAAGVLVDTGVPGLYGRSAAFEDVLEGLDRLIVRAGADQGATRIRFAPVEPKWAFEKTGYLESFPDLTGAVHTFVGDDRAHRALLAAADKGDDWSTHLAPADVMLCPAVCHPLYPTQSGRLPAGGRVFDLFGWSFRHEPSDDPARMQAFRIHEYVYLGEPDAAEVHRDRWIERGLELLGGLGLDVRSEVANDPFFGRLGKMLATNQRDENLKYEVVTEVASAEKPTAIMSSNLHRDHFGVPFSIESADGAVAHSSCVGFGMERCTLALFKRHGMDLARWPADVRGALEL